MSAEDLAEVDQDRIIAARQADVHLDKARESLDGQELKSAHEAIRRAEAALSEVVGDA